MLRRGLVAGRTGRARSGVCRRPAHARSAVAVLARAGTMLRRARVAVGARRSDTGVRVGPAHTGLRVARGARAGAVLCGPHVTALAVGVSGMCERPALAALRVAHGTRGLGCGLRMLGRLGVALSARVILGVLEHPLRARAVTGRARLRTLLVLGRVA